MTHESIEQLLKRLEVESPSSQTAVIQQLVERRTVASVPALIRLLHSPSVAVRSVAAYGLGQLGSGQTAVAGPALLDGLEDSDELVRCEAVDALQQLNYAPAIARILGLLRNDPDATVRASAAEALGELCDEEVIGQLEGSLSDGDESVRAYAAAAIGWAGTQRHLPVLAATLQHESSPRVRGELLAATYRLGHRDAAATLAHLIEAADEDVAVALLNVLDDLVGRRVSPFLPLDAAMFLRALRAVAERIPILEAQVRQIEHKLDRLANEAVSDTTSSDGE